MKRVPVLRKLLPIGLVLVLAGCGGGGGGGGGPTGPPVPVISNLRASFAASCDEEPATTLMIAFDYVDPDGNLAGGRVHVQVLFQGSVVPGTNPPPPAEESFQIPDDVEITGTTSGKISLEGCVIFQNAERIQFSVSMFDAAGNRSNFLRMILDRPAGAPLVPKSNVASSGLRLRRR